MQELIFFSMEHGTILDKSESLDYELGILDVKSNYRICETKLWVKAIVIKITNYFVAEMIS